MLSGLGTKELIFIPLGLEFHDHRDLPSGPSHPLDLQCQEHQVDQWGLSLPVQIKKLIGKICTVRHQTRSYVCLYAILEQMCQKWHTNEIHHALIG